MILAFVAAARNSKSAMEQARRPPLIPKEDFPESKITSAKDRPLFHPFSKYQTSSRCPG
jgi:hypothetical protein